MSDLRLRGLYGITDPQLTPDDSLYHSVEQALEGGMRILQYRNKTAGDAVQLEQATRLKTICHRFGATFIINDNLSLCLESGADGLHLGQSDASHSAARNELGENKILGITCHDDLELAKKAIGEGADYVAFGRLFPSKTKPRAPHCELSVLKAATELNKPIVGIGGIEVDNAQSVIDAGSDMIAVINGLFGQQNIKQNAVALSQFFTKVP